jgi:hypothetical protein
VPNQISNRTHGVKRVGESLSKGGLSIDMGEHPMTGEISDADFEKY